MTQRVRGGRCRLVRWGDDVGTAEASATTATTTAHPGEVVARVPGLGSGADHCCGRVPHRFRPPVTFRLLGHSSPDATMLYVGWGGGDAADMVAAMYRQPA